MGCRAWDAGLVGYRTGGMPERREAGKKGGRKEWRQERREAKKGRQERSEAGKKGGRKRRD